MSKIKSSKIPANIFAVLIAFFCCLSTGARAQCPISGGNDSVCVGSFDTLTNACIGTWASTDTSIATVSATGIVRGVRAGTVMIRFRRASDTFSTLITVRPLPYTGLITGPHSVCRGSVRLLSNSTTGGSWISATPAISSVTSAGNVRGVSWGNTIISYSITNSCGTAIDTHLVHVDTAAVVAPHASLDTLLYCNEGVFDSMSFYFTPSGGAWRSTSTGVAAVNPTTGRLRSGAITGDTYIIYSLGGSCAANSDTILVRVGHTAQPISIIGSASHICPGSSVGLFEPIPGGIWYSPDTLIAAVDAMGIVTANIYASLPSTVAIRYTVPAYGSCPASSVYVNITVDNLHPITGLPTTICAGHTTLFSEIVAGGIWNTSDTTVAVVTPSAATTSCVVTGLAPTTAVISYTCPGTIFTVTRIVTVVPSPPAPSISGLPHPWICFGASDTLTGTPSGGIWTVGSGTSPFVTIGSSSGILTGITTVALAGSPTSGALFAVHYTISSGGCSATTDSTGNTAMPTVSAGTISGPSTLCPGTTISLTTTGDSMGVWSSSNPAIATVDSVNGQVTYVSTGAGTVTITYAIAGNCNTDTATFLLHTYDVISAGTITPPSPICPGSTVTLTTSGPGAYGSWSSSNPGVAIVASSGALTGVVSGIDSGTAVIFYTFTNPCGTSSTSVPVTVLPRPTVSGPLHVCIGLSTTLPLTSSITGGVWSSSDTSVARVAASGIVTGVSAGTVTITYTLSATGCIGIMSFIVEPTPVVGIGLNGNPPAPYPAVMCTNTINLTAHGAVSYTWNTPAYLYFPGTAISYVTGMSATSLDVHYFTLPIVTYTITGTSAAGCVGTTTYSVVHARCDGAFCPAFTGTPIYALSGNIGTRGTTTLMPSGNYNVQGNTTFLGKVQFSGNVLAIAPNFTLTVDTAAQLSFDSSHLYCCDRIFLWNGIVLAGGTATSGKLSITRHSCVEDAKTAVKVYDGIIPASGYTFRSTGTIYNRNRLCVDIARYPAAGSPEPTPPHDYPFYLTDNVFTSRDLTQFVPTSGYGWPMQYPATSGTSNALKAAYTPTAFYASFMPHYNIINPNAAGTGFGYPYQSLNDGTVANMGIRLNAVGSYATSSTPNDTATYNGIVIGEDLMLSGNAGMNMFDTLYEGIYALSSNLTSYNNTFMYMHKPAGPVGNPTGDGITAVAPLVTLATGVTAYPKYNLVVSGSATNNQFFDCTRGIGCQQYYHADIENAAIIHSPTTVAAAMGQNAVSFLSRRFHNVTMTGNEVTNMQSGLTLNTGMGGGFINQFSGRINVSGNTINSNMGGAPPVAGSGMGVVTGINLTNMFLSGTGSGVYSLGDAYVDNNTMNYVNNGIAVIGYHFGQVLNSKYNTIRINNRAGTNPQYGISHRACFGNIIDANTIYGPGLTVPATTYGTSSIGKITGIYGTALNGSIITCNYTGDMNAGFQFSSANLVNWLNNEMNRNSVGMALNGTFGDQGNLALPSNNIWKNALPWWTGSTSFNIYTWHINPFSMTPWADTIYVDANSGSTPTEYYDPMNNTNNPIGATRSYGAATAGTGNGIYLLGPTGTLPVCLAEYSMYARAAKVVTSHYAETAAQEWIAENNVWQMLQHDPTLVDSSAALAQFAAMAADSRFKWLGDIEAAIMSGDKSTAATLLSTNIHTYVDTTIDSATGVIMKDGIAGDDIVNTYVALYSQYLKYMDSTMNGDDSIVVKSLASLCPLSYGNGVYQAQALYRITYEDDTTQFDGSCETDTAARHSRPIDEIASAQSYKMFPNPNNGNLTLRQTNVDATPVSVTVKDVVGRTMFAKDVQFIIGSAQLQLGNLAAGMYVLQIIDSKQKISNFKFVIQK